MKNKCYTLPVNQSGILPTRMSFTVHHSFTHVLEDLAFRKSAAGRAVPLVDLPSPTAHTSSISSSLTKMPEKNLPYTTHVHFQAGAALSSQSSNFSPKDFMLEKPIAKLG